MENRNIIRFKFSKKGGLKYISHLDLQRAIARIIKRSHIPIRYTQGFNPHPKMVFALTLGVGMESECELLDVYMIMDESKPNIPLYTPEEFKSDILPNLPIGLDFIDAYYPEKPFIDIRSAKYLVSIDLNTDTDITHLIGSCLSSPMVVFKKSKAGDRDVDISPMIRGYSAVQNGTKLELELTLAAEQNNYLSPELVVTGLKKNEILYNSFIFYSIKRLDIIFN